VKGFVPFGLEDSVVVVMLLFNPIKLVTTEYNNTKTISDPVIIKRILLVSKKALSFSMQS
jgi:hypothetical protein